MAGEVGSVFVRVGANTGDFDRGMGRVHGTLSKFGGLARVASRAAMVGGAAIAGGFALAIKAAANFEQQLNTFQAVSNATGKEMAAVSKLAKKMGKDLTLPGTSAKDAAEALTELAKGGLSVNKAMGALKATLQLSAAAQISNARAAVIVSDALNAFGLKAKEASRVVDLLANAANATSGDIEDFADALQMSGAVAKQLGVPIEDLVTMLGEMANAGIKGSDAGTSVKQMLLSLAAPTEKSANLMKDLGISIFDAQGKFAGMHSVIDQFHKRLSKMTDAQKASTLATIFGSDAIRAAAIIFGKSAPEFERLKDIMEKQGAAAKLAEAKMKGFKGALEGLKSSLETLAINIGEPLLRFATRAVKEFSKFVEWLDRLRAQKGFTAKIKFVWSGIKELGGFLEDLIMGKGKTSTLVNVAGRGPRWLTEIDKGLAGALTKAFQSINWGAVWKTAMSAVDWAHDAATRIFSWLGRQDWEGIGAKIGSGLVQVTKGIFGLGGKEKPGLPLGMGGRTGGGGAGTGKPGLWEGVQDWFTGDWEPRPIWQKMADFTSGFFKGVWKQIEGDAAAATFTFGKVGTDFATALSAGFSSYMRSTRGFQREAQTGANEVRATGGQYGAAGTHLGQSTSTGLVGALQGMAAAASSKAGAGASGIESKKGAYTSAGEGLGSATSSGLTGALAGMAAAAGSKAAAGASAISGKKGGYQTAGQALGNSTKAGLTGALSALGPAAAGKVDAARSAISGKTGGWASVGSSLGSALVSAASAALSALASVAANAISGALAWARRNIGSTAEEAAAAQLGRPLGKGVIQGWLDGTRELPTTMSDTVRKALDRAKAAVDAARAKFSEAFSTLASDAMSAFDKVTSAFRTKTEKLIDAKEFEFMMEDANRRVVDAQARLAEAMAEGNAEAISSAQRELARAQWDLEKIHLEKVAEAERRNYEARRELQQRHFEKALATLQKKLEDGKIKIGTFHSKVLSLFAKFGIDLGTLGDIGGKAFVKMLLESLGAATTGAAGIASAINAALSGAGTGGGGGAGGGGGGGGAGGGGAGGGPPANPMAGQPPAHADPLTASGFNWYEKWWRKSDLTAFRAALRFHGANYPTWAFNHPDIIQALGWPWMAKGGIVKSPTFAMLGEKGPEAVIPLNRGGGMLSPVVNVYVTLDGRQIAAASRTENIQHGRRNPTVMSGRGITA